MPVNTTQIRHLMQGISQSHLARTMGMKQPNLHRLITGKTNPTLATLDKLARALGVRVGELLV